MGNIFLLTNCINFPPVSLPSLRLAPTPTKKFTSSPHNLVAQERIIPAAISNFLPNCMLIHIYKPFVHFAFYSLYLDYLHVFS